MHLADKVSIVMYRGENSLSSQVTIIFAKQCINESQLFLNFLPTTVYVLLPGQTSGKSCGEITSHKFI